MDRRLVKIAQELNVSIRTITEFLGTKGIHVLSKPTSKIDEHTYQVLLKEFRKDMVEKMKADNMTVGKKTSWLKKNDTHPLVKAQTGTIGESRITHESRVEERGSFSTIGDQEKEKSIKSNDSYTPIYDENDAIAYDVSFINVNMNQDLSNLDEVVEKKSASPLMEDEFSEIQEIQEEVKWGQIKFFDGSIWVAIGSQQGVFPDKRAKKIFNLILPFFIKQNISPPSISINGNKAALYLDTNFFNLLEVGKLIYDLQIEGYKASPVLVDKINSLSNSLILSNSDIIKLFTQRLNECIEFLAEKQEVNLSIIPAIELVSNNDKALKYDESFIFTVRRKNRYFLIWESVEIKKATHVFEFNEFDISEGRKKLQSYVLDIVDYKRERLHNPKDPAVKILNHVKSINHTNFQDWKMRLLNVINVDSSIKNKTTL